MSEIKDRIKGGINFEEDIIGVLAMDIVQTSEFKLLDKNKKDKIIALLKELVRDSMRHKELLENIANKY